MGDNVTLKLATGGQTVSLRQGQEVMITTQRPQKRVKFGKAPLVFVGHGAQRPQESIMYAAHWDAYGTGPADASGRTVRPGAVDDALGVAGLLEIARAFQQGPRPARSLLFAAWTAEEPGLLGSEYYGKHPLQPALRRMEPHLGSARCRPGCAAAL